MLEVTEVFASLQGEGPFMGKPALFLRLSGCVVPHCPWCDTPESLRPGKSMTVKQVWAELGQTSHSANLIVITGGEPFLQWRSGLQELEAMLLQQGCNVQYETSGKAGIPTDTRGFVVCSPKYLQGQWHIAADDLKRVDAFKFVAGDDLTPICDFIAAHNIANTKVWIMPLGATRSEQLCHVKRVWEFCVAQSFNFTPRLHILTFDQQRGV